MSQVSAAEIKAKFQESQLVFPRDKWEDSTVTLQPEPRVKAFVDEIDDLSIHVLYAAYNASRAWATGVDEAGFKLAVTDKALQLLYYMRRDPDTWPTVEQHWEWVELTDIIVFLCYDLAVESLDRSKMRNLSVPSKWDCYRIPRAALDQAFREKLDAKNGWSSSLPALCLEDLGKWPTYQRDHARRVKQMSRNAVLKGSGPGLSEGDRNAEIVNGRASHRRRAVKDPGKATRQAHRKGEAGPRAPVYELQNLTLG